MQKLQCEISILQISIFFSIFFHNVKFRLVAGRKIDKNEEKEDKGISGYR